MRTISQTVEEILRRMPFLAEVISEGVGNNAEIARRIKPEVEKKLYEEVSESAIAMALHRLSREFQVPAFGAKFLRDMSGITVRSNLIQFTFHDFSGLPRALATISETARNNKDAFVNFSKGLRESLLIVSQDLEESAASALGSKSSLKKITGLSAITMQLPEASLSVPGVYYPILKALAQEGISMVEVMSVRTEFSILLADKDIERAFSIIKRITS